MEGDAVPVHALDVLGDPVRRRILELLADDGELSAGEIGQVVQEEFGISQPAVSQHLRLLREHGFASVRPEGRRRLYALDPRGPQEAREWLTPFERFWLPKLDALGTELSRGKRQRRLAAEAEENGTAAAEVEATAAAEAETASEADAADRAGPAPAADTTTDPDRGTPPPTQKET